MGEFDHNKVSDCCGCTKCDLTRDIIIMELGTRLQRIESVLDELAPFARQAAKLLDSKAAKMIASVPHVRRRTR